MYVAKEDFSAWIGGVGLRMKKGEEFDGSDKLRAALLSLSLIEKKRATKKEGGSK